MVKVKKEKLSQEMINNIKNYSDQIITLEDFVATVRQNPGYLIGAKGNPGFINMIREIVQNGFDEIIKQDSPCTHLIVSYDERTQTVIVEDNGRGIPFGHMIRIFENQSTSSNYNKKKGEFSSGLHGVGAKVTNALSTRFIVESYVLGEARKIEFVEGHPWKKGEVKIPSNNKEQGTRITFTPSMEVMGPLNVSYLEVYNIIKLILPLTKIGAYVLFNAIDINGKEHHEKLVNRDGIMTYLYENCKNPLIKPITLYKDTGEMKMDIVFTYDIANMDKSNILAFGNTCPTQTGDHINGFYKGVGKFFTNYMNKVYLANSRTKLTVTNNDIKVGISGVVSAFHLKPIFNGQSKDNMNNPDLDPFISSNIVQLLDEWFKENPKDLEKVCKYLKEVAEIRLKSDKEKIRISNKYVSSPLGGMPAKFVKPTGNKDLELWICEGDSASGHLENFRNNKTQGYFPIRGKIPNAFSTTKDKFLANQEIASMITIIGGGYGKNFDVSKVKWKYIVIASDADADGFHIATLFMYFFLLYMPGLIESGKVFKAQPPLYGLQVKKGKFKYFTYQIDYVKYIQKEFSKTNEVKNVNNKVLSSNELSKLLFVNIDYTYYLNRIAKRYSVDPLLLESILILKDQSNSKIRSSLKKDYRFIKVESINGVITITGSYNDKFQTLFLSDKLISDCKDILNILSNNESLAYILNGKVSSICQIMNEFDRISPNNIERYKGLGEMSGEKLFDSTVSPDNRSLVRFTMDDVNKEFEQIRYYESSKARLLDGVKVTRFDLM